VDLEFRSFIPETGINIIENANDLTFVYVPSEIDHDALSNYVSNEHIDHTTVSVTGASGVQGGGTIDGNITLSADATGIDHDSLQNYVANEHIDHSTVFVTGDGILSGGGYIDVSRTISLNHSDVDHDQTTNFVSNEHIDHTAVSVIGASGVKGGGTIDGNITLSADATGIDHNILQNYLSDEHTDHSSVFILSGTGLAGGGDLTTSSTLDVDIMGQTLVAATTGDFLIAITGTGMTDSPGTLRRISVQGIVDLASGGGGGITGLIEDPTPTLGANLNMGSYIITSNVTNQDMVLKPNGDGAFMLDDGGNARGEGAVDLQMQRSANNQVASGKYSVIAGGSGNQAYGDYTFIAGGYNNTATGKRAVILGGRGNTASSTSTTIIGSYNGTVNSTDCIMVGVDANSRVGAASQIVFGKNQKLYDAYRTTVIGGFQHRVYSTSRASDYATIVGGSRNTVADSEKYGTILGGTRAQTDKFAQQAFAAGSFTGGRGEAQSSRFVARNDVTHSDTSWTELFLDGSSKLLTIPQDTSWVFSILLVGQERDADVAFGFTGEGVIKRSGSTVSLVGGSPQALTSVATDAASYLAQVSGDNSNNSLAIQVSNNVASGVQVNWVAHVLATEVKYT